MDAYDAFPQSLGSHSVLCVNQFVEALLLFMIVSGSHESFMAYLLTGRRDEDQSETSIYRWSGESRPHWCYFIKAEHRRIEAENSSHANCLQ